MAGAFSVMVPVALAVLLAVMCVFGGLSYEFYAARNGWAELAFLAGMVVVFIGLMKGLRGYFQKFSGRLIFAVWLIAVLGSYFAYLMREQKYPMGIDLAGGAELIYSLDYSQTDRNIERTQRQVFELEKTNPEKARELRLQLSTMEEGKKTAPDKAAEVVRKRVDPTGTKGIPVTTFGSNRERLRIQLPKASPEEVARIMHAVETQGRLAFHIVAWNEETIQETKRSPTKSYVDKDGTEWQLDRIEKPQQFGAKSKKSYEEIVMKRVPEMDGSHVTLAVARHSTEGAGYEIGVRFDPDGQVQFAQLTGRNVKHRMAIVLDNKVYSAPTIQEKIEGECRISGNFDKEESEKLASVLTAGSLPAEVKLESRDEVGPSLGQEQIHSGMQATVIATVVVVVFMLIYYRLSGAIAAFCMILNLPMLLGAMGFFKATLTLPGIAGIVLTLGMAVDANVLILERLREELARGRPLKLAVSHGFDRAFLTIIDCQLTTLISAIVLYYLGTGPVRGFSVTLAIGILTSLFCNLWLNWIMTEWLVAREWITGVHMMQFFKTTNLDFMGWRRMWMTATGTLAVVSLALIVYFTTGNQSIYDVDFTGGTLIQFNFAKGKEQDDATVKRIVGVDVRQKLDARLADITKQLAKIDETVAKLRPLADLTGDALTKALASVSNGEAIAKDAAVRKDGLREIIQEMERANLKTVRATVPDGELIAKEAEGKRNGLTEVTQEYQDLMKDVELSVQSFGTPEAGTNKYHSFTLTTRLSNPVATGELNTELRKVFQDSLEPDAVSVSDKEVVVRFADLNLTKADVDAQVHAALVEAAKDATNAAIKPALLAVTVGNVEPKEGYLQAQLTGLPADPQQLQKVGQAIQLAKIPGRIGGPISRTNGFGSQVAGEMKWQALLALIIANIGVFIYLWFRFEFSGAWGFGAIVALIHDVTIAAGGVVIAHLLSPWTGFPILINLNIVAALLTIVGFSVNDTIVVFDRIREVKGIHPTRSYEEIVNEAVNATLSRTILTSLTVLLADVSLLIWGGPTIRDMAYTLLVGFTVGTYSSIFIASPLMIWWYRRFGAGRAPTPGTATARAARDDAPSGAQI